MLLDYYQVIFNHYVTKSHSESRCYHDHDPEQHPIQSHSLSVLMPYRLLDPDPSEPKLEPEFKVNHQCRAKTDLGSEFNLSLNSSIKQKFETDPLKM